jgi:bla regulator protein blaR1
MLQKHFFLMGLAAVVVSIPAFSQQEPAGTRLSFEVATVKPSASGGNGIRVSVQPGGRFVVNNATLKMVMAVAYRVRDFQISGGPGWTGTDRWDIEAKAEEGSIPQLTPPFDPTAPNPLMLMVQSLLEDRFQLKIHREAKEMPVYELAVAKGGAKIKLAEDQSPPVPPERGAPPPPKPQRGGPMPRGAMGIGRGSIEANGVPIDAFIQGLSQQLGRPIVDKTGMKGFYDIKLQWTPELGVGLVKPGGPDPDPPLADASSPSIFTAIQEQLGLRLDSAKGPVDILVIDSVQKPTEN